MVMARCMMYNGLMVAIDRKRSKGLDTKMQEIALPRDQMGIDVRVAEEQRSRRARGGGYST